MEKRPKMFRRNYTEKFRRNYTVNRELEETTLKSSEGTTLKTSKEKTTQKIINLMTKNPEISIEQLASLCSLTRDGINWQIRKLKESGKIHRVGPDKGGHWEICE